MKQSYSDLLKDPRWQKKRLEILSRDSFTCQFCQDKERTLHVHHIWYEQETPPWGVDDSAMITLCESCHDHEAHLMKEIRAFLINDMRRAGLHSFQISNFSSLVAELGSDAIPDFLDLNEKLKAKLLERNK